MTERAEYTFLEEVAQYLQAQEDLTLDECCLVFPNRRSGQFFLKALKKDKPVWVPDILSISDFASLFSTLKAEDQLPLLIELYEVCKEMGIAHGSFTDFYSWGNIILEDFNDLDLNFNEKQNGSTPERIFHALEDQKELEMRFGDWKEEQRIALRTYLGNMQAAVEIETTAEENIRHRFNSFWSKLPDVYTAYRERLQEKGIGYNGLIFKQAANAIEEGKLDLHYQKVIFLGFNNLSYCEESIISTMVEQHDALVIWDADSFYVNNPRHEAGLFIRNYSNHKALGKTVTPWLKHNLFERLTPQTEVIGVSSSAAMAKTAAKMIREKLQSAPNESYAIILPDKAMLFPILHSLPPQLASNVTMGYPLQQTAAYSLIDHLLQLQKTARVKEEGARFYHKPLIALINHPYLLPILGSASRIFNKEITAGSLVYASAERLISNLSQELTSTELCKKLFELLDAGARSKDAIGFLLSIISFLKPFLQKKEESEVAYLRIMEKELLNLQASVGVLDDTDQQVNTPSKLIRQVLKGITIPFETEATEGIQVMGTLESRNLDFDNVYILSMNEGKLPPATDQHSFIPYNLRKGFGLPAIEEREAMYSYYFYRLFHRAKNVFLFYNTEPDELGGGDISRLVLQLRYEAINKENKEQLKEYVIGTEVIPALPKELVIPKNNTEVQQALARFLDENNGEKRVRLSPSALNTYLDCQLRFYFNYVAGIKEPDEVQEEMDAATFGNILHIAMENFYTPFIGKTVTPEDIQGMKKQVSEQVDKAFCEQFLVPGGEAFEYDGRNMLIRDIITRYVEQILNTDETHAPFEIVALEAGRSSSPEEAEQYTLKIPVELNGKQSVLRLGGVIDRIDRKNGTIRIVDYKTGKDETAFTDIESLFGDKLKDRNKVALQTLLYGYVYQQANPAVGNPLSAAVYSVKQMFSKSFNPSLKISKQEVTDMRQHLPEFSAKLQEVVNGIFDTTTAFVQTEEREVCGYCPYSGICHREE